MRLCCFHATQLIFFLSYTTQFVFLDLFYACVCCYCWSSNEENYGIPFVFMGSIDEYLLVSGGIACNSLCL
jgi:hypothetical protein